jgi:hypothetical protein
MIGDFDDLDACRPLLRRDKQESGAAGVADLKFGHYIGAAGALHGLA